MNDDREAPLKRISDGLLPRDIRDFLFDAVLLKVGPAEVNGWSFVHMFSGWLVSRLGYSWKQGQVIHAAWEGFQFISGDNRLDLETAIDVPLDTMFFAVGQVL